MRRAMRIILNGLTVLSLVLAICVVALWAISYVWTYPSPTTFSAGSTEHVAVHFDRSGIEIVRCGDGVTEQFRLFADTGIAWQRYTPPAVAGWRWAHEDVMFPYLRLVIILLAMPCGWLVWRNLRLQSVQGARSIICPACGYDLRATPDRCSECGAVPTAVV